MSVTELVENFGGYVSLVSEADQPPQLAIYCGTDVTVNTAEEASSVAAEFRAAADAIDRGAASLPCPAADHEPVPFALTEAAALLPRRSSASVAGVPVPVDCPPWCVSPHGDESHLEDVSHYGALVALSVPTYSGGTEEVLRANLTAWPFSQDADERAPRLAVDGAGDGEVVEMPPAQALAFADQLVAHAAELRRLARIAAAAGARS